LIKGGFGLGTNGILFNTGRITELDENFGYFLTQILMKEK